MQCLTSLGNWPNCGQLSPARHDATRQAGPGQAGYDLPPPPGSSFGRRNETTLTARALSPSPRVRRSSRKLHPVPTSRASLPATRRSSTSFHRVHWRAQKVAAPPSPKPLLPVIAFTLGSAHDSNANHPELEKLGCPSSADDEDIFHFFLLRQASAPPLSPLLSPITGPRCPGRVSIERKL
jgi:hypothetical protein